MAQQTNKKKVGWRLAIDTKGFGLLESSKPKFLSAGKQPQINAGNADENIRENLRRKFRKYESKQVHSESPGSD
jgi:hypothetical protein